MPAAPIPKGAISRIAANNLRRLREDRGLTQATLAARVAADGHQLALHSLRAIEKGRRRMDIEDLVGFCTALNCAPSDLLGTAVNGHGGPRVTPVIWVQP